MQFSGSSRPLVLFPRADRGTRSVSHASRLLNDGTVTHSLRPTSPTKRETEGSERNVAPPAPGVMTPRPHSLPPLPQHPRTPSTGTDARADTTELDLTASLLTQEGASRKVIMFAERRERKRALAAAGKEMPSTIPHAGSAAGPVTTPVRLQDEAPAQPRVVLAWQRVVDQARALCHSGRLTQAYLVLSSALPEFALFPVLWAQLRIERARCSYALINYRECVDDCEAALSTLAPDSEDMPAAHVTGLTSASSRLSSLPVEVESLLWSQLTRACVMREDYARAGRYYEGWLARAPLMRLDDGAILSIQGAHASLPAVQAFRTAVVDGQWEVALTQLRGPSAEAIASLAAATPLRALEAVVLLELDFVDEARASLLSYLPTLLPSDFVDGATSAAGDSSSSPGRPSVPALVDCTAEEKLLYRNLVAHYLQCTVTAAKASIFTSPAYLNVAAVLVKRCLLLEPTFAPAMRLGAYLVAVEDLLTAIHEVLAKGDWASVLVHATEGLRLDTKNTRLMSILHVYRAEALAETDKPLNAIEACTRSARCNPSNARAYFMRALLHRLVREPTEAAADWQRAAELAPALYTRERFDDECSAMQARQHARTLARAASSSRPRAFSPPATSLPASTRRFPRRTPKQPSTRGYSSAPPPLASPPPTSASPGGHETQTLYDVLQVSANASTDDIRRAYKTLTLRYHPDKVVNESEEVQMYALHMFKRINEAHHVLADATKRAAYDNALQKPL